MGKTIVMDGEQGKTNEVIKLLANAFSHMKASIVKSMKLIRQFRKKGENPLIKIIWADELQE